jgi:hypothetical protein
LARAELEVRDAAQARRERRWAILAWLSRVAAAAMVLAWLVR